MITLAHIVNPYRTEATGSRLQSITMQSMLEAKAFAASGIDVELYAAVLKDDPVEIPSGFNRLLISRSILDDRSFARPVPYPYIEDILKALYAKSTANYLIYTNMDIILLPHFYRAVSYYLALGHDALIINRRRIPYRDYTVQDLPAIWSIAGEAHPGFDCFVFHRALFPQFRLKDIIVGIPFIGVTLAYNIFCFSQRYLLLDRHHLTTHIGMEVMPPRDKAYYWHNRKAFEAIRKELKPLLKAGQLPWSSRPFPVRMLKRILNPSVFTAMSLELEGKGFLRKVKYILDEWRFRLLDRL